ncbi:pyroglutamyl-peptidase I [Rhodovibrionaceae bacterium A322]
MRRLLLTGFEAFGTTPVNPAEGVARMLDGASIADATVTGRVLPNNFFECIEVVKAAIDEVQPEAVIMLGEYGGRALVTVERLAQNLNDGARYGLQDNAGKLLQDDLTEPEGPTAYRATLPIRAMVKTMREHGIPADISDAAGTFCCNHLMYGILHHLSVTASPIRAGWIHLPHLPEVAALEQNLGAPSMSLETSAQAVRLGLEAILQHPTDITDSLASRLQI